MSFDIEKFEQNFGNLDSSWPILTLSDVCLKERGSIISGPFGSNISSKYFVNMGIPVIRGNNLTQDLTRFVDDGFVFVTEEKANELNTLAKVNDLIFTAAGTIGQVGIITSKCRYHKYIISNKQLRARVDKSIVEPLFAYYWFASSKMNKYIKLLNTGSTIPLINLSVLKGLPLPVPEIHIQRTIIKILESIDDKIELNNRMKKVLEQMAQAIFKQWFVDFEFPNENGEPYKSSGGEMEWCKELGKEIPVGWKLGLLSDLLVVKYGKDHKKLSDGEIPVYGSGGIMRYVDKALYSLESVLIPRKGTLNNIFYVADPFWSVDTMFFTEMRLPNIAKFIYLFMKEKDLASMNVGSAVPSMTTEILNNLEIIIPPNSLLLRFEEFVSQLFIHISNKKKETIVLSSLRDTLLPKLMSGEIDVSEIEI